MFHWYAVATFSTFEFRVKKDLERRAQGLSGIRQIVVPSEPVEEVKNGRKLTQMKRTLPGYVLVHMDANPTSLRAVRSTAGVIGFVGGDKQRPSPLAPAEVEQLLGRGAVDDRRPKVVLDVEVGETISVAQGPFVDFSGEIIEVNEDGEKLKVLVEIFGRKTPVEVGFDQVKLAA